MKKILFISAASEIGGAEKVILDIAGVLKGDYELILLNQSDGSFPKAFEAKGLKSFKIALPAWRKFKNILRRWLAVYKVCRLIKEEQIDIIHCNSYRVANYAYWAMKLCDVKAFVHMHEHASQKEIKKYGVLKFDNVLCVANSVAKALPEQKRQVIYNAVDTKKFHPVAKESDATYNIGIVAHLNPVKRHNLFIDVAAAIKQKCNNVQFTVVGGDIFSTGLKIEDLRQQAQRLGIEDCVEFKGTVAQPHIYMQQMDAFLLTSEREACPLVLLEAMACGCIVFADINAGGPTELIENGVDGFLVDFTCVNDSAEKIIEILYKKDILAGTINNAINKIESKFSTIAFKKNLIKYYESL